MPGRSSNRKTGHGEVLPRDEIHAVFGNDPPHVVMDAALHLIQASPSELFCHPILGPMKEAILDAGGPVASSDYKSLAWEAGDRGDLLGAIGFLHKAVECNELDADAHFRLGAMLGQLGDVEGAFRELEIAVQLDPAWDLPRVEIAIVLLNLGRDSDAVLRLEAAQAALAESSG